MEIGVDHQRKGSNARLETELGRKKSSLRRKRWRWREALSGYLFILSAILGFLIFVLYPLVASAYYALTRWDGVTIPVFVGFKIFSYIFMQDPSFLPTLRATGLFALLSVSSSLIVGLLLAVLLNRKLPGIKIFRIALYLPAVLPSIATLTLWKLIYNPQFGLVNQFLAWLHLPTSIWLSSEVMAIPAIVLVSLWGIGSTMIIFLAGLQPPFIEDTRKRNGRSKRVGNGIWYLVVSVLSILMLFPLLWMITLALKSSNDIYKLPSEFLPKEFHCGCCYHAMELLYGHQSALYASSKIIGRWTLHIV